MIERGCSHSILGLTYISTKRAYKVCSIYCIVFAIVGEVACVQFVLVALFSNERSLPNRCWYPFDALVCVIKISFSKFFVKIKFLLF